MKIVRLEKRNYYEVIMKAVQILREGGAVVVPTDTVYALAADATNDEAIRRLFQIKKREKGKPIPIFADTMARAKQIAFIEERKLEETLHHHWPGTFIAILYAREVVSPLARARGGLTVGARIPDLRFLRDLIRALGKPITGTSANLSGEKPATTAEEISLLKGIDMIIDGGMCDGAPSTIVDFTVVPPKIMRP